MIYQRQDTWALRKRKLVIRAQHFLHGFSRDVRYWCKTCTTCIGRRLPPGVAHHPHQRQVVSAPWQRVVLDVLGPLGPPTDRGKKYLLVMVDYLTNWVEVTPVPNMKATACAQAFVTNWVLRVGILEQLHSDLV